MSADEFDEKSSDEQDPAAAGSPTGGKSSGGAAGGVRSVRRAQREAERAARAQRRADEARARALEAARAGGLFEGMQAMPAEAGPAARSGGERVTPTDSAHGGTAHEDTAHGDTAQEDTVPVGADGPQGTEPRGAGAGDTSGAAASARGRWSGGGRRRLVAMLTTVAAVAAIVAGLATWGYVDARSAARAERQITAAPYEATEAAREITTQMFTYDHRTVDADLGAVRDRLTDPALSEFVERSMPSVASAAKEQEATVFATVAAAAPETVQDADHVTVLVMVNRMVSTKENPKAASSASRLRVDMERKDGVWKLSELTAL